MPNVTQTEKGPWKMTLDRIETYDRVKLKPNLKSLRYFYKQIFYTTEKLQQTVCSTFLI